MRGQHEHITHIGDRGVIAYDTRKADKRAFMQHRKTKRVSHEARDGFAWNIFLPSSIARSGIDAPHRYRP